MRTGARRCIRFIDMHDLGDMLVRSGFADPVMEMEYLTLTYARVDGSVPRSPGERGNVGTSGQRSGCALRAGASVWRSATSVAARGPSCRRPSRSCTGMPGSPSGTARTAEGRAVIRFDRAGAIIRQTTTQVRSSTALSAR